MDALLADVNEKLTKRADDLTKQLSLDAPECFLEQKHTDSGTAERTYWHYGYLVAVRDVLALLNGPATPSC